MKRACGSLLLLSLWTIGSVFADDFEATGEELVDEIRQLESEMRSYAIAREEEARAVSDLEAANRQLDARLADPRASLRGLRELERSVEAAREEIDYHATQTAAARRDLYQRMERIGVLMDRIEGEGVELVPAGQGVTGTWKLEAPEQDLTGILSLRQEGTFVRGSYRTSLGTGGSLRGTVAGGELEIQLVDREEGKVGVCRGTVDPEGGRMAGSFEASELGSGRPTYAEWTARRVTLETILEGD